MAQNLNPIFVLTPNVGVARITVATTASNGAGTLVTLLTASLDGTRVDGVRFRNSATASAGATTAMTHKIFYSPTNQSGSGTCFLVGEVLTSAVTRAVGTVGATSIYTFDLPLYMPSGSALFVAQSAFNSPLDQFDAQAFAGNY